MLQNLGGVHLIVIVFIVLLLFGAPKLPGLAKSLGQSMKILKQEVAGDEQPRRGPDESGTAQGGSAQGDSAPAGQADVR